MKATNFKNFMELLKDDRKLAESMGYAFLDCTEKQLCKVIDYYSEIGECALRYKNGKYYLEFANCFSFPYDEYERITGKN